VLLVTEEVKILIQQPFHVDLVRRASGLSKTLWRLLAVTLELVSVYVLPPSPVSVNLVGSMVVAGSHVGARHRQHVGRGVIGADVIVTGGA